MPLPNPLPHATPLPIPTPQRVHEFQALYKQRFGVNLPQEQAADALTRLMQFVYLSGGACTRPGGKAADEAYSAAEAYYPAPGQSE